MRSSLYLIAGLGKTGLSIAHYLQKRQQPFIVFDTRKDTPFLAEFAQQFPSASIFLEKFPENLEKELAAIIVSPGLSLDLPLFQRAFSSGLPVYGDIECFAKEVRAPVIAITGTNGKSTVTTLVGEMAKAAGFNTAIAGNIGAPVLELLDDGQNYDLWVLELSSFQLDLTFSLAPFVATILNVTPDHLDRHHTMEAYIAAKQRIYLGAQKRLYNRQDPYTKPLIDSNTVSYGADTPVAGSGQWGFLKKTNQWFLAKEDSILLDVAQLSIKGLHNWQNALAACALAELANIPRSAILKTLMQFSGLPHRCQWVRTLEEVEWINDSKGTNLGATISAVLGIGASIKGKIILIAGGQGKGADFQMLEAPIMKYVRSLILIGEDANKIAQIFAGKLPLVLASSLKEAVELAKKYAIPKDTVLLSPACASLDMFRDFNHRGEVFNACVEAL